MPKYDIKCQTCETSIEIEVDRKDAKEKYRRKCTKCGTVKTFVQNWQTSIPAYHDRFSPMHPRAGRGRGGPHRK